MSEWLTTGQMLDRLKVGEVAETNNGMLQIKRKPHGIINITNDTGEFFLNETVLNIKWRILPKYVTFEEAIKALEDGQEVRYCGEYNYDMGPITYKYRLKGLTISDVSMCDLYKGKWQIIE